MIRLFALLLLTSVAQAASPTVAVMPFKDLSGQKGSIGEAIRETVTTDLKDVSGMKVIERSFVDKILSEQNLQANKADLDPTSTVKVGKLLGASLIVAGAYQKASSNVRLTARFVKVETGEIVGTAKVDGQSTDFLKLQDKITTELLRSAGIEQKKVELFAKRARPKVKSLRTIELYGDAVVEKDDAKKRDILKLALNEDPGFSYATRDLDELEKRLKHYDTANLRETDKALRELKQQIATEKDPTKLNTAYQMMFAKLLMQRRYRTMVAFARDVIAHPPPPSPYSPITVAETAQMYLVQTLVSLKEYDGALREGEKFLAEHAGSMYFGSVRMQMDQAINKKREMQEGGDKAQKAIAELPPGEKGDPCKIAQVYKDNNQWRHSREQFDVCLATNKGPLPQWAVLMNLVQVACEQADWSGARKYLERLKQVNPEMAKNMSGYEMMMPADG